MAVPKRKTSPSKRGMRCSHDAISGVNIVEDKTTGELKRSHHISLRDGFYKGRQVIKIKSKNVANDEADE